MAAHGMPAEAFEIAVISTKGDRVLDRPLAEIGGKGLFTEEIETQLADGRIDFAVHSSKDMPTTLPDGFRLSAFLPREDVRDAFIGRTSKTVADLPEGAVVGSSSLRRQALIRRLRPDVSVVPFRGNVQTRLRKMEEGEVDGTLLAMAGLRRLGIADIVTAVMEPEAFPPAPGQGAICVESRIGDDRVDALLGAVDDADTRTALDCERSFLAVLDGSCRTPIAGLARVDGRALQFSGMVLTPDGQAVHEIERDGTVDDAVQLGEDAGHDLRTAAGPGFLSEWQ